MTEEQRQQKIIDIATQIILSFNRLTHEGRREILELLPGVYLLEEIINRPGDYVEF